MLKPLIVDIKRNALDDGPGIRTTVFFKGCPLSCVWCQNPETINTGIEIMFSPHDCIGCNTCLQSCPEGAVDFKRKSSPVNRVICRRCGTCVDNCPGLGMKRVGRHYSIDELSDIIIQDIPFFRNSGGGITLSGGEPTMYPRYLEHLLQVMQFQKIHVNLETCGYYSNAVFQKYILPYINLIYFDIKFVDGELHRRYTGRDNKTILYNFKKLIKYGKVTVLPRIPLVPEVTATPDNLQAISQFLKSNGIKKAALLPYNPTWVTKADNLGKNLSYRNEQWLTPEEKENCAKHFADFVLE